MSKEYDDSLSGDLEELRDRMRDRLAECPDATIWSNVTPHQVGWYWYKSKSGRVSMVYLKRGDHITSLMQCTINKPDGVFANDFKGSWSPELIPPTEPGY